MELLNRIYKCNNCGNIVELLHDTGGQLSCCGQRMTQMRENSTDASLEKHVPVIEETENGTKVTIGSIAHPMDDAHYIEWIELVVNGKSCKQFLKPGDAPVAEFKIKGEEMAARAYCNLHGLWRK